MQLIGFPSLIIGLVLWLAGGSWFHHAVSVGEIVTLVSAGWILLWSIVTIVFGGLIVWLHKQSGF